MVTLNEADDFQTRVRLEFGDILIGLTDVHRGSPILVALGEIFSLHVSLASWCGLITDVICPCVSDACQCILCTLLTSCSVRS